jgi:hypothetical protein
VVPQAALPLLGLANSSGSSGLTSQQLALAIVLPVLAVLLLVVWLSCLCLRQLRSLLRALGTQRKRALGLPSKGRLTVAVTDIQGFTHLSETHPQAMGQVMGRGEPDAAWRHNSAKGPPSRKTLQGALQSEHVP